jgi:hypothetical protein
MVPQKTKANRRTRRSVDVSRLACTVTGLSNRLPITLLPCSDRIRRPVHPQGIMRTNNIAG